MLIPSGTISWVSRYRWNSAFQGVDGSVWLSSLSLSSSESVSRWRWTSRSTRDLRLFFVPWDGWVDANEPWPPKELYRSMNYDSHKHRDPTGIGWYKVNEWYTFFWIVSRMSLWVSLSQCFLKWDIFFAGCNTYNIDYGANSINILRHGVKTYPSQ